MTLSSRHRIRSSSPGGLRPSSLPLGHGGSPQYWIITSEQGGNIFLTGGQSGVWTPDLQLSKQAALTTASYLIFYIGRALYFPVSHSKFKWALFAYNIDNTVDHVNDLWFFFYYSSILFFYQLGPYVFFTRTYLRCRLKAHILYIERVLYFHISHSNFKWALSACNIDNTVDHVNDLW